jgi:hydroxymethylbilane synthase
LKRLRIGTRGSALALWQAKNVAESLLRVAGVEADLVIIKTSGDKFQHVSFSQIGAKGVFIKELEDALIEQRVDLAVHSMKDVPVELPSGLTIAAICRREDVRDALLCTSCATLKDLPVGARVGTSSLRRKAQLLHARRDLQILELRGNVDTRIEKLKRGDYDAIVLAKAGLDRLGLNENITEVLPTSISLPAAGQGAIGIEARSGDEETLRALSALNDLETRWGVDAERSALAGLGGGCQVPIGAWGRVEGGKLTLEVAVLSTDGVECMREQGSGAPVDAQGIGRTVAQNLQRHGAAELLAREGRSTSA